MHDFQPKKILNVPTCKGALNCLAAANTGGNSRIVSKMQRSTYFKLLWIASKDISEPLKWQACSKNSSTSFLACSCTCWFNARAKQKKFIAPAPVSWP